MNELLQPLRLRLDALPRERRYEGALRLVEPLLPPLSEWAENLDEDGESNIGEVLKEAPLMIRQWATGEIEGSEELTKIWDAAMALYDITFENYHQGADKECAAAEILAWLAACAIHEEGGDVGSLYDYFEGYDDPESPHLVEVVYRVALVNQGITALKREATENLEPPAQAGISDYLKRVMSEASE